MVGSVCTYVTGGHLGETVLFDVKIAIILENSFASGVWVGWLKVLLLLLFIFLPHVCLKQ